MTIWRGPSGQIWHVRKQEGERLSLVPEYGYDDATGSHGSMRTTEAQLAALGFQRIDEQVLPARWPAHGQEDCSPVPSISERPAGLVAT